METIFGASAQLQVLFAVLAAVGVGLFGHGFALWRRRRRIEDTPTSKLRSLALGRVEVVGRARPGTGRLALRAPITDTPCVFFRFRVEEERRSGRRRSWQTIASGVSDAVPFAVEDETGRVLVDPRGAVLELEPQLRTIDPPVTPALRELMGGSGLSVGAWLLGAPRIRVTEARIHEGDPVYVLGLAQSRHDAARRHDTVAPEDPVVLARDPAGEEAFVVSAFSEHALVRRLFWRSLAEGIGGASLTLFSLAFLVSGRA